MFQPISKLTLQVTFALVVVQNGLVILLALILNPIARRKRAAEGLDPECPSQEYLSRRRGTQATQYSTASTATMVDWSSRASRIDLEKAQSRPQTRLDMSRTDTIAVQEEPNDKGVALEPVPEPAGRVAVVEMEAEADVTDEYDRSGTTTRVASEAPTPLARSRNPTLVDLQGLTRLSDK